MKRLLTLLICLSSFYVHTALAADMAQDLAEHPLDPAMEQRLVDLSQKLRCLVCQNESLASSHAELAEDLRREVREQMAQGKSDQQIIDYLVARYGDFVLYDPPVKSYTLLLWFGPLGLLLIGGGVMVYQVRKRRKAVQESELTPEAQQRAAALLNEEDNK